MKLTYQQCEYIAKQYKKLLEGKVTAEKLNATYQKYFNVSIDFTSTIKECYKQNKGSYDIGWLLADV